MILLRLKKTLLLATILVSSISVYGGAEEYDLTIVPSAPEDKIVNSFGSRCSPLKNKKTYLTKILAETLKSQKTIKSFSGNENVIEKWNVYHDAILELKEYKNNYYNNPLFYSNLTKSMINTQGFYDFHLKLRTSIYKENEKISYQFNKDTINVLYLFKYNLAKIFLASWREQKDSLNIVKGLVEAELAWTLIHNKSINHGKEPETDWWFYGGLEDALTRGLICNPKEVILALTNKRILDSTDIKIIQSIPSTAKKALTNPIGLRIGSFSDGKYLKKSNLVEKRRKIAQKKYLPQINKIIADYLKDKKADK